MLELLTLLGFQCSQAVVDEHHDTAPSADEPPHQAWSLPLTDEALLAELYAFHGAEHC